MKNLLYFQHAAFELSVFKISTPFKWKQTKAFCLLLKSETYAATLDHLYKKSAWGVLIECSECVGGVLEEWVKGASKVKAGKCQ